MIKYILLLNLLALGTRREPCLLTINLSAKSLNVQSNFPGVLLFILLKKMHIVIVTLRIFSLASLNLVYLHELNEIKEFPSMNFFPISTKGHIFSNLLIDIMLYENHPSIHF